MIYDLLYFFFFFTINICIIYFYCKHMKKLYKIFEKMNISVSFKERKKVQDYFYLNIFKVMEIIKLSISIDYRSKCNLLSNII